MADIGIKIRATDEASGVFGKVAAEAGKLQGAVAQAGASFATIASGAAAALGVMSFAGKIKDAIDLADSFNKLSQKTGVAVEELSKLNYAAGLSDVSTEALSTGLKKLNLSISAAGNGGKEQAAIFKALGISVKDAAGNALSADKVLGALAESFAQSADGANKTAVAVALLGKSGADLIPLLNAGAGGLNTMGNEAKKLGIVMGADFAKNAEEFNDNLRKVKLSGDGLFITLAGDLVKALGETAAAMANAAIEGGKLAGIVAGIQTLFTGTDQYKNDKALVEQTELKLKLENSLLVARQNGNAAYIKSREDALAAVNAEIKTTMAYRKVLQDLEDTKKKAETPKPTKDSDTVKRAAAAIHAPSTGAPKEDKGNAFAAEQEAAKEWAKALEAAGKAADDLTAKNLDLGKSEAALKTYMESTAATINEKTNPAMNAMVRAALDANAALEAMAKLADTVEAAQKRADAAREETSKERERVAAIGETTAAVAELTAARLEETAAAKERALLAADEIDLSGNYSEAIKAEVAALRERAALLRTGAVKEAAIEAAKESAAEWKRGWEQTDALAREAFADWATEGGNAAKRIGDALKKALLSAIYEATIKPIVMQIYTSITGGTASVTGGLAGNFSNLSSMYSMASGAMGSVGGGVSLIGNYTGSASLASYGAGMSLSTSSASAAAAAYTEAAASIAASDAALAATYTEVAGSLTAGAGATSGFATAMSAIPVWGWIAMAFATQLGGPQIDRVGGGVSGILRSNGSDLQARTDYKEDHHGLFGIGAFTTHNSEYSALDESITNYVNAAVVSMTAATKGYAAAIGLSADAVDDFAKQIDISLDGLSAQDKQAAIDKAIGGFIDDMITAAYGSILQGLAKAGETSSQTLQRLATTLVSVNATFKDLGATLFETSIAGAAAAASLVDAMGGLQAFQSQTRYFFENFYSDAERQTSARASLAAQFDSLHLAMPDSKAAFRELLLSLDLTSAEGRKTAAALYAMAPAFASIADAAEQAAQQLRAAAESAQAALTASRRSEIDIQAQIDQLLADQAASAAAAQASALQEATAYLDGVRSEIQRWLSSLNATDRGGLNPQQQRDSAWADLQTQLALARGGDRNAMSGITGYADQYLNTIRATSKTALEEQIATSRAKNQLANLPGQVTPEQFIVTAVDTNGAAIVAAIEKLRRSKIVAELTTTARSEITKLITFVANTDKLPADLKALALETIGVMQKTIDFVTGSDLSVENKQLALATNSEVTRLINLALNSDISDEHKRLALATSNTINKTISFIALNFLDDTQARLALATTDSIVRTISAAAGVMDADALLVAAAQSETIRKTIEASGGVLTPDQQMLLNNITDYNKTIQILISQASIASVDEFMLAHFGTKEIDVIVNMLGGDAAPLVGGYINDLLQKVNDGVMTEGEAVAQAYTAARRYHITQEDIAYATGYSIEDVWAMFDRYSIPRFAVGTDLVPRDMIAMLHEGEQVVPKAYNPHANGIAATGGANTDAVERKLTQLQADLRASQSALAALMTRLVRLNEKWDGDGLPEARSVAA